MKYKRAKIVSDEDNKDNNEEEDKLEDNKSKKLGKKTIKKKKANTNYKIISNIGTSNAILKKNQKITMIKKVLLHI